MHGPVPFSAKTTGGSSRSGKLTISQVRDMRAVYDDSKEKGLPAPCGMLANKYNLSTSTVWRVVLRKAYRDVK